MTRHGWLQTSWAWQRVTRFWRRIQLRLNEAAQRSISWKMLARSGRKLKDIRLTSRQAIGYVIAGGICGLAGMMIFGSRSLNLWDVGVRSLVALFVLGLMARCAASAGK